MAKRDKFLINSNSYEVKVTRHTLLTCTFGACALIPTVSYTVADSEPVQATATQQENTYDVPNPEYDVIMTVTERGIYVSNINCLKYIDDCTVKSLATTGSEHTYANTEDSQSVRQPRPLVAPVSLEDHVEQQHQQPQLQREAVAGTAASNPPLGALRRIKSQKDNLSQVVPDEPSDPIKRQRASSWTLPSETNADQQIEVRVYDSVAPPEIKAKERVSGEMEYNKLSYRGYSVKKLQSPHHDMLPLASQYSKLNFDTDPITYNTPSQSTPVYSVPDKQKKREKRQMKKELSDEEPKNSAEWTHQDNPMKELPPHNYKQLPPSSPLYSNLEDEMNLARSTAGQSLPIYNVPKKREEQQISDKKPKDVAEHTHQDYPVKELPPQSYKQFPPSSPLYSNLKDDLLNPTQSTTEQCIQVYSVSNMKKKREEREKKATQPTLTIEQNVSSPSPPPLPPPLMTGRQIASVDDEESRYPHVSIPFYFKEVRPMPTDRAGAAAEMAHLYDYPKRMDVYKPLPLEGFYDDLTNGTSEQAGIGLLYDQPTSLSLVTTTKESGAAMQKQRAAGEEKRLVGPSTLTNQSIFDDDTIKACMDLETSQL